MMKLDEFSLPDAERGAPRIASLFRDDDEQEGNSSFRYQAPKTAQAAENAPAPAPSAKPPLFLAATTLAQLYRVEKTAAEYRPLGAAGCVVLSGARRCSLLVYDQAKKPFFRTELRSGAHKFSARGLYLFSSTDASAAKDDGQWCMLFRDEVELAKLARVALCAQLSAVETEDERGGDGAARKNEREALAFGGTDAEQLRVERGDTVMCSYATFAWKSAGGGLEEVERHEKVKFEAGDAAGAPTTVPAFVVEEAVGLIRGSTRVVAARRTVLPVTATDASVVALELKVQKIKKRDKPVVVAMDGAGEGEPQTQAQAQAQAQADAATSAPCHEEESESHAPATRPSSSGRSGTLKERMARLGHKVPIALPPKPVARADDNVSGDNAEDIGDGASTEKLQASEKSMSASELVSEAGYGAAGVDNAVVESDYDSGSAVVAGNEASSAFASGTDAVKPPPPTTSSAAPASIPAPGSSTPSTPSPPPIATAATAAVSSGGGAQPMAPPPWWYTASVVPPTAMMPGTLNDDYIFKATLMEAIRGLGAGQARIADHVTQLKRADAERDARHREEKEESDANEKKARDDGESARVELESMRRERDDALELLEHRTHEAEKDRATSARQAEEIESYLQDVIREKEEELEAMRAELDACRKLLDGVKAGEMGKETEKAQVDNGEEKESTEVDDGVSAKRATKAAKNLMMLVFEELGAPDAAGDDADVLNDDAIAKVKEVFRACFKRDEAWLMPSE